MDLNDAIELLVKHAQKWLAPEKKYPGFVSCYYKETLADVYVCAGDSYSEVLFRNTQKIFGDIKVTFKNNNTISGIYFEDIKDMTAENVLSLIAENEKRLDRISALAEKDKNKFIKRELSEAIKRVEKLKKELGK